MRLVFLSSGGGATAEEVHSLIEHKITIIFNKQSTISILADRECGAIQWASKNNIPNQIISLEGKGSWHTVANMEAIQMSDIIISTIHRIIPSHFVQRYGNKLINVHYSILPAFQGLIGKKTVQTSLDYGSMLLGATCHYVTEKVDAGKPICQVAFPSISSNLDEQTHKCFLSGCLALINAISLLNTNKSQNQSANNTVKFDGTEYMVNPCHIDTQNAIEFLCKRGAA